MDLYFSLRQISSLKHDHNGQQRFDHKASLTAVVCFALLQVLQGPWDNHLEPIKPEKLTTIWNKYNQKQSRTYIIQNLPESVDEILDLRLAMILTARGMGMGISTGMDGGLQVLS